MPFDSRYPSGSEWRRWDLHIHSPLTTLSNEYEGTTIEGKWNNFLARLELFPDVVTLGITDYFSIRGYNEIEEFKNQGRIPNIQLIVPNVELRILPVTQNERAINLHLLFDPKIVNILNEDFFNKLEFTYNEQPYPCNRNGLIRLGRAFANDDRLPDEAALIQGVIQFKTTINDLRKIFNSNPNLRNGCLIGVSNSNQDGNSGIQESGLAATRQDIYQFVDFIFSGNPRDREYFLGDGSDSKEEIIRKYGNLKPCIHGCDAHSLPNILIPDLNRNCWIKADPTFEGLKQIIFEPRERVRIQQSNPEDDFGRPYFSKINIRGQKVFNNPSVEFFDLELPLNRGLITIVGGRGSGKSLLLDMVRKTFRRKQKQDDRTEAIVIHDGFDIEYIKEKDTPPVHYNISSDNILSYLHVNQGEVKSVVHPPEMLYKQIFTLLGIDVEYSQKELDEEIDSILKDTASIRNWFEYSDSTKNLINSRQFNETKKKDSDALIQTLTTTKNKALMDEYRTNKGNLNRVQKGITDLNLFKNEITSTQTDIRQKIAVLNHEYEIDIPDIDLSIQTQAIETKLTSLRANFHELMLKNGVIETNFREQGIEGDITSLLEKVSLLTEEIQAIDNRLIEIKKKEAEYDLLIARQSKFAASIVRNMVAQRQKLTKNWKALKNGKVGWGDEQKQIVAELLEDIQIDAIYTFDKKRFIEGLYTHLNGKKFRETAAKKPLERVAECFRIENWKDLVKFLIGKPKFQDDDGKDYTLEDLLHSDYVLYGQIDAFLKYLYESRQRVLYLRADPVVKYKGKIPDKLSVGQRGTLFVSLKLATDAFSTPFVYDQPEDDLDNEFIMQNLVPVFRRIKKYRQVIIVTHNANLVVNADAEQVIVADNQSEQIRFISGSIENSFGPVAESEEPIPLLRKGIRQHVCDVLEGGKSAFQNREQKYGFK